MRGAMGPSSTTVGHVLAFWGDDGPLVNDGPMPWHLKARLVI